MKVIIQGFLGIEMWNVSTVATSGTSGTIFYNPDKRDCRWLKNQCLVCGANDHRVGTCPNRRTGDFQRRNGEFTDRRFGRETNPGRDRALN